ncbi:MAG: type IV toxin-antitoxin system AbiEi family antitoxin [Candidatus Neomarinimicrobiota bacterium]
MKPIDYIRELNNSGIWSFTFEEAQSSLGKDITAAIRTLRKKNRIIDPARGFYVIIPEEFSIAGRLPAERFINELMKFYRAPYYIGLLTAASFYGSAHQSPQVFQVVTNPSRRTIHYGQNKIVFYRKKNVDSILTDKRKTLTGYVNISTVETTFFDMIQFNQRIGGLDHVTLVASELVERFSVSSLKEVAMTFPLPIIQRGGYLLEVIGFEKGTAVLERWIRNQCPIYTYLNPSKGKLREPKHDRWKLIINDKLDYSE